MRITPTLAALALIGIAAAADDAAKPAVPAVTVDESKVDLSYKLQLQVRAYAWSDGRDGTTTQSYDPLRGQVGKAEWDRLSIQRARLYFDAKTGDGWFANITFRGGEDADRGNVDTNRYMGLYYAFGGKKIKTGDLEHSIDVGLNKAFTSESICSSNDLAFPQQSPATMPLGVYRNLGINYIASCPDFAVGASVRNSFQTTTKDPQAQDGVQRDERVGHLFTLRAQYQYNDKGKTPKRRESYLGATGTDAIVGMDLVYDNDGLQDDSTAGTFVRSDVITWGPDVTVHSDALTAIAELKLRRTELQLQGNNGYETGRGPKAKVGAYFLNLQAAYAMPMEGSKTVVEPAFRFAVVNNQVDSGNKTLEYTTYTTSESAPTSGWQTNLGTNIYWRGDTSVKTQIAWQHWVAEAGSGRADLVVVQQQLTF